MIISGTLPPLCQALRQGCSRSLPLGCTGRLLRGFRRQGQVVDAKTSAPAALRFYRNLLPSRPPLVIQNKRWRVADGVYFRTVQGVHRPPAIHPSPLWDGRDPLPSKQIMSDLDSRPASRSVPIVPMRLSCSLSVPINVAPPLILRVADKQFRSTSVRPPHSGSN